MGRAPQFFPFRYHCAACKMSTVLSAAQFNGLPALTLAELDEIGQLEPLLKDLRGAGFADFQGKDGATIKPAEALFAAGFTPVDLKDEERAPDDKPLTGAQ